jgi:four helix bundle protein
MTFLFEKLTVYQKAQDFADRVSALTARFPRSLWYLADQFNRGSLSIPLNIAESNGRGTPMDKRRFLYMARGSVFECASLLDMCRRKELVSPETKADLGGALVELSKMLSAMIASLGSPDAVREEEVEYV